MNATTRKPTRKPAGVFDSLEQEAYLQLWRTFDRLREIEEQVFCTHGINAQQYNVLRVLKSVRPQPMTTSMLMSRLVSRAPDMTRLLDRLEEQKLVQRERCPDNRRTSQVSISDKGIRLLEQLESQVQQCSTGQLGHMPAEDLRRLIALLKQARSPHEANTPHIDWPGNY